MGQPEPSLPDPGATLRSRAYLGLLAVAAVAGAVVSFAGWAFLEVVHELQVRVYTDLPDALGLGSAPQWWPLPVLAVAGLVTAWAIVRLPGSGGHVPADGLSPGATQPLELPGVLIAALASIGLGVVLGPEAPLIALGSGLALLLVRLARRDVPPPALTLLAAAGSFAALSLVFGSPLIAAVILIEAVGVGGGRAQLVLLPGLLAAGIGSLVYIGMGSWSGLNTSAYSIEPLSLPDFPRPAAGDFAWSIALGVVVALGTVLVVRVARRLHPLVAPRPMLLLPVAGLAVGALAIAFSEATDRGVNEVLFSGQDALSPLMAQAGTWSVSALVLLILFKGAAWSISLAGFRGGPTFPAMLLGAAGGVAASHLPGFALTPAVAVGIGAAVAAMLRLPLSAIVLAVILTAHAGAGTAPLVVVGVVAAFLVTNLVDPRPQVAGEPAGAAEAAPAAAPGAARP